MQSHRWVGFFVTLFVTAVCLTRLHYDGSSVALRRAESALQHSPEILTLVQRSCSRVTSGESAAESWFAERLSSKQESALPPCELRLYSESETDFFLKTNWRYRLEVFQDQTLVAALPLQIETPTTLAFLPIFAFFFAHYFQVAIPSLGWMVALYALLLSGLNLYTALEGSIRSIGQSLHWSSNLWGMVFLLLFVAKRQSRQGPPLEREVVNRPKAFLNRFVGFVIGSWNPVVYVLSNRLLQVRYSATTLVRFLDLQVLFVALGLFWISSSFNKSWFYFFELPRYFTFTFCLLLLTSARFSSKQRLLWKIPGVIPVLFLVALLIVCRVFSLFPSFPLLSVGALLLWVGEMVWTRKAELSSTLKTASPWIKTALIVVLFPKISAELGAIDTAFGVLDPRAHPNAAALFIFIAGIGLAWISGDFATAFFTLMATTPSIHEDPLLRAALLDGALAGIFLSPVSFFNLMTQSLYQLPGSQVMDQRMKQLVYPLVVGVFIYGLGTLKAIAILRPVTFIFVILVLLAFRLRNQDWIIGRFSLTLRSEPR